MADSSSGKDVQAPGLDGHAPVRVVVAREEMPLPLVVPVIPPLEHHSDDLSSSASAPGQATTSSAANQDGGLEFPPRHHVVVDATLPTGASYDRSESESARRVKDGGATRQSQSPPSFAQSEFHMVRIRYTTRATD